MASGDTSLATLLAALGLFGLLLDEALGAFVVEPEDLVTKINPKLLHIGVEQSFDFWVWKIVTLVYLITRIQSRNYL
jgi:hypothetical protein